ncbi:MAG: hypothetical protein LC122_13685 [Chitinophagales bacterium]|nr:hypothetical protein [Chitinophagales bacterium]
MTSKQVQEISDFELNDRIALCREELAVLMRELDRRQAAEYRMLSILSLMYKRKRMSQLFGERQI